MVMSGLSHCCHHNQHWEWCHDLEGRLNYIKQNKRQEEQTLRLRLLKIPPEDMLPGRDSPEWESYIKAWEACDKAEEDYRKAGAARDKAGAAYAKSWEAYAKSWEAYDKARAARNEAWVACDKAWAVYRKAGESYDEAWVAYDKAGAARDKARAVYLAKFKVEFDDLHARLFPDCPWDEGRKTIFTRQNKKGEWC